MRVEEHALTAWIENPLVHADCQPGHSSAPHTKFLNTKDTKERKGLRVCFAIFASEYFLAVFAIKWPLRKTQKCDWRDFSLTRFDPFFQDHS